MKIYTKTGDDGTTGLFGADRVPKDHLRIDAYGTVDELNATLGICLAQPQMESFEPLKSTLDRIQNELFVAGGDLASPTETTYPVPRIQMQHILQLEQEIDVLDADLSPLKTFILPAGHPIAAHLHLCRTVTRRAERICVALNRQEALSSPIVQYLNRLSDYFFTAARWANAKSNTPEIPWKP
jgi:cob(I)alamin adenosyltransferase